MECRTGCGACCIVISITSSILGTPDGNGRNLTYIMNEKALEAVRLIRRFFCRAERDNIHNSLTT
ncbi:hypothetical protein [Paenibacillus sp. An7]|uniref:hypothetical protein n=1 Tax=Paenibacillus sp. An7 TaxID=2689577 RepID=UPI0019172E31|nr:hypothetical protein [Paenibacillus sp. An7]